MWLRFAAAKAYGPIRHNRGWHVMTDERSYIMRRAAQERAAALTSRGKAREAHQQMARKYEEKLEAVFGLSTPHAA